MSFTQRQLTKIQGVLRPYGIKYCSHCMNFKPLQEFAHGCRKVRNAITGEIDIHMRYKERCKSCSIVAVKQWRNQAIMSSFNYTTESKQLSLCL
jgi:hypothetical protein